MAQRPPPLPKMSDLAGVNDVVRGKHDGSQQLVEFLAVRRLGDGRWQVVEGTAPASAVKPLGPPHPPDAEHRAVAQMQAIDESRRLTRLIERNKPKPRKAG